MIRARLSPSSTPERVSVDVETDHEGQASIWWETTSGEPPAVPDRLDPVAIALIPKAMAYGQDLHLEGPVSWSLLAGLEEHVDAWVRWRPDRFRPVAVQADEVVDDRAESPGALGGRAVAAFSGGVDGTYAAVANQQGLLGRRSLDLSAAVLIHGFDVPLDDDRGFALAAASARAITEEIGVPLVTVRTNWQTVDPEWQMTFGAAIAAVLHLFTDRAGTAIVAADNTYDQMVIPWGSNPVTVPLLSSRRMRMVQPGAGVSRTEKCAAIGALASVRDHIRVCWAGDEPGRNCGRCEKCVRTKVNFLAAGVGTIPALGPLEPGQLASVRIGSTGARAIYEEMLNERHRLPQTVADELAALLGEA